MTRDEDLFISLKERARIANEADADLFISIHANASLSNEVFGIETYSMDTASDEGARRVASRENTMAEKQDGSKDMLLGQLVSSGTNRLSSELAASIQETVVKEMRKVYGPDLIKDLLLILNFFATW